MASMLSRLSLVVFQLIFVLHQTSPSLSAYVIDTVGQTGPVHIDIDTHFLNLTEGEQHTVACTVNRGPVYFFESPMLFVHVPRTCEGHTPNHCRERVMATNGLLYEGRPEFYDVHINMAEEETVFVFVYRKARGEDRGVLRCQLWREQISNFTEIEVDNPGQGRAQDPTVTSD